MIRLREVSFQYDGAPCPVLNNISLAVPEGEFALVAGATSSGKSTLLRLVNGLVPHFTGGRLSGEVRVAGASTRHRPPRRWAETVGYVGQAPRLGFVRGVVEDEVAFGMEQLGWTPAAMRLRVEETLDLMGIEQLRDRDIATLSGGEAQRVAIGAALAAGPRVLVLDEPTSALDPGAAEDVLAAVARLVHDLGMTVMAAEHRLERAVQIADTVIYLDEGGTARQGPPGGILKEAPIAPPIVELGRLLGWDPLPMSVRDARRLAQPLRQRLEVTRPVAQAPAGHGERPVIEVDGVTVAYGDVEAVRQVSFTVNPGEIAALMGRNGSGKSSLLWAMRGIGPRTSGRVAIAGEDPAAVHPAHARALVALVPDEPADLLYLDSVAEECGDGGTRGVLARLLPGVDPATHPRDLSEGERLALVLALQLAHGPSAVLLDEPTRGLDYAAKDSLANILRDIAGDGTAILLVTHDVEFAARVADRVMTMAQGEIIGDGPAGEVLASSPALAPQVSRILGPEAGCLTVGDVRRRVGAPSGRTIGEQR